MSKVKNMLVILFEQTNHKNLIRLVYRQIGIKKSYLLFLL